VNLIDRYEIGEPLGVGGTATVFRATHRVSGRQVAVKIFDAARPVHRSEVSTLAGLDHPGLVAIDEVGSHNGSTYLAMRLVEGESLAQRIARGPLPPADVVAIGARLADTLSHVHGHGVVHRDVKPSNVLLDAGQVPHLTDFGVSKLVDATRITATGSVVGTPAYMAPEQVRGQEVGSAADVYALGLVLLEALSGRREYPGSVVESAVARLHRDPVVPPELPVALRTMLTAMTTQEPADRPPASTVARRLAPSTPTAELPAPSVRRGPPAIHRPWARAAVAASVLLIAGVLGIAGLVPAAGSPVAVPPTTPASTAPTPTPAPAAAPATGRAPTPSSPAIAEIAAVVPIQQAPVAASVPDEDDSPATIAEPADGTPGKAATGKGDAKVKKVKSDKPNKKGNGKKG
jgi:eukaryotic-like serine/threonine-protein kinase